MKNPSRKTAPGAEEFWRSYVASGPRTNIAHGLPTNRKLQAGDLIMIDIHPIVNGYSADICRTVCVGRPSAQQQAAHDLYLKAQQATIAQARAGAVMTELAVFCRAGGGEHAGVGAVEGEPLRRRIHCQ